MLMSARNQARAFGQTGTCSCCTSKPGPQRRRTVKRAERAAWRREARQEAAL